MWHKIVLHSFFLVLLPLLFATNCTNVHRGTTLENTTFSQMKKMVDKKSTMQQITDEFGAPSFINSPIDDTICYVEAKGKKVAFNRFYNPTYNFVCVSFKNGIANSIESFSLVKIKQEKFVKYKTNLKKPV